MKLENSVILNGKIQFKSWRPVKEYLDMLQSEDSLLVERKIAEFVFKRLDRVSRNLFFNLNPNQAIPEVRCTPLDENNNPLLGFQESGIPQFAVITTAKLLSHPYEVYEARIHLKQFGYNIVKRIVFKITQNNGEYYRVYTDYCDKTKFSTNQEANDAVTDLAYACEDVVTKTDFDDPIIKLYLSEGVDVSD